MSIFDNLQHNAQPTRQQALEEVKRDPHGVMKRMGLTVPEDMTDPLQMADYLISSGQITGPRAQMARQLMARMGR
ncbi:MAG: hypothetical protein J6S60_07345 [Oscillospiraceae bacterium]|nr:hypothetical protein [Oscillospiraceae bacterium]